MKAIENREEKHSSTHIIAL